jgi:hypothetical protein
MRHKGKQVFILHSFGRNFALFYVVLFGFRTELAKQSAAPIEFLDGFVKNHAGTPGGLCGGLS